MDAVTPAGHGAGGPVLSVDDARAVAVGGVSLRLLDLVGRPWDASSGVTVEGRGCWTVGELWALCARSLERSRKRDASVTARERRERERGLCPVCGVRARRVIVRRDGSRATGAACSKCQDTRATNRNRPILCFSCGFRARTTAGAHARAGGLPTCACGEPMRWVDLADCVTDDEWDDHPDSGEYARLLDGLMVNAIGLEAQGKRSRPYSRALERLREQSRVRPADIAAGRVPGVQLARDDDEPMPF